MMRPTRFEFDLEDDLKGNSDFQGWTLFLTQFSNPHEMALFELRKTGFPCIYLTCFGCWPIPVQKRWTFSKCSIEMSDEECRIYEDDFEIRCKSFYVWTGKISGQSDFEVSEERNLFVSWHQSDEKGP